MPVKTLFVNFSYSAVTSSIFSERRESRQERRRKVAELSRQEKRSQEKEEKREGRAEREGKLLCVPHSLTLSPAIIVAFSNATRVVSPCVRK